MILAGSLLIVAAILKFHEMLTVCIPSWTDNKYGFWESYEFFLVQIPLEFALGVWMVSGLFRKAAWIAGTLGYFGFILVTIFKIVTGAESCGCFGRIEVDPKITLFAIDIPIFLLLAIFRPKGLKLLPPPWPNLFYMLAVAVVAVGPMVFAAPAMVAFRPDCKKAEDVKPDQSAREALQEYLKKQQESKKQPQTSAQPLSMPEHQVQPVPAIQIDPQAPTGEYSYGKLNLKTTEQPDIFTFQVDQKQAFALNIADPDKILITPLDPVNQQLALLPNGVEVNWQTEPIVRPVAVSDPNVTIAEVTAREQMPTAAANSVSDRDDFSAGGPVVPPMPGGFSGGDPGFFDISSEQTPEPASPETSEPNAFSLSDDTTSAREWMVTTAPADPNAADPEITEPDSADPNTGEPNNNTTEPNAITPTDEIPQWDWLRYVVEENLRSEMAQGLTVVLMYHHDCPTCAESVPKYSDYCRQMSEQGFEEFKIVFLAVPPYSETGPVPADTTCRTGKLTDQQKWQIMSPYVVALLDGQLVKTWKQGTAPEPDSIIDEIMSD
jgi:hypothetical protein